MNGDLLWFVLEMQGLGAKSGGGLFLTEPEAVLIKWQDTETYVSVFPLPFTCKKPPYSILTASQRPHLFSS